MFVPLFFAHRITDVALLISAFYGFAGFCLAASAVYVLNDMVDVDQDRAHPLKRFRPLAAKTVERKEALFLLLFLLVLGIPLHLLIADSAYSLLLLAYVALNIFYSFWLQRFPVIDSLCVAAGFVFRIFAGALVIEVSVSGWLTGLTFLLALFIAFAKRWCDWFAGKENREPTGPTAAYTSRSLAMMVVVTAVLTAVGYMAYTLSPAVVTEHNAPYLYLSGIWVLPGIGRYLHIVFRSDGDCSPVTVLFKDVYLQVLILLWLLTLWAILYTDIFAFFYNDRLQIYGVG